MNETEPAPVNAPAPERSGVGHVIVYVLLTAACVHISLAVPFTRAEFTAELLFASVVLPLLGASVFFARGLTDPRVQRFAGRAFIGAVVAVATAYPQFPNEGIASPVYRTLVMLPLWAMLLAAIGSTASYVLWGEGRFDARFSYERFVGWRYLRSLRGSALSVVTYIALGGVILGVGLLIVALSILSGFEGDLIDKIMGASAHVSISKHAGYAFEKAEIAKAEEVAKANGAAVTTPFVKAEVLLASDSNHDWAYMFGVVPETAPDVYKVLRDLSEGSLDDLRAKSKAGPRLRPPTEEPDDKRVEVVVENPDGEKATLKLFPPKKPTIEAPMKLPGVIIGHKLAKALHLTVGDTLTLVSPMIEELTPRGPAPKMAAFRVAGLFKAQTYEIDAHSMYVAIEDAQRFLELGTDVSGVSMLFNDPLEAESKSGLMMQQLGGYPFQAVSWESRNRNLFLSLKLEKAVAFLVLIFVVLVASFSIVNTLTMSVIEKAREIAILKTLGGKDVGIAKIFFVQGATIGIVGSLIGGLLGAGVAIFLQRVGVYIDPEVYTVDKLPIRLHLLDVLQAMTLGCVLTSLSAIFPALQGARLSPVEGLRYE